MKSVTGTRPLYKTCLGLLGLAGLLWCGVTLGARAASADSRDSDGSRLQASSMSVGSTQRDTLLPPRDRSDWRSFKVTSQSTITISLSHQPASASVSLALTDARGGQVASTSSSKGAATLKQSLSPGIYYVSVSSSSEVSYSLGVN